MLVEKDTASGPRGGAGDGMRGAGLIHWATRPHAWAFNGGVFANGGTGLHATSKS